MGHTHELRLTSYDPNKKPHFSTQVLVRGTKEECYKRVEEIAEEEKVGKFFLLSNGGYRIVDLAEEKVKKAKEAGPELLEALKGSLQMMEQSLVYRKKNGLKIGLVFLETAIQDAKAAIKKATS